jgi:hypothetical protein
MHDAARAHIARAAAAAAAADPDGWGASLLGRIRHARAFEMLVEPAELEGPEADRLGLRDERFVPAHPDYAAVAAAAPPP